MMSKLLRIVRKAPEVPVVAVHGVVDVKSPVQLALGKMATSTLQAIREREEFGTDLYFDVDFELLCRRLEETL